VDLGGEYIIKHCFSTIEKYVDSTDWIESHAGYTAIAWITEGCTEVFKKHYESLLR